MAEGQGENKRDPQYFLGVIFRLHCRFLAATLPELYVCFRRYCRLSGEG